MDYVRTYYKGSGLWDNISDYEVDAKATPIVLTYVGIDSAMVRVGTKTR